MAWTAPRTWVTGELTTAAELNEQVRDNEVYLKDTLPYAVSWAEPSRALGTIYQNTSGKIRFVSVSFNLNASDRVQALCDSSATPTTIICDTQNLGTDDVRMSFSFIACPNYYYKVYAATGSPALSEWHEWDLH